MLALLVTLQAYAAGPKAAIVFKDNKGAQITVEQAWQISARGETVYRCQQVQATDILFALFFA